MTKVLLVDDEEVSRYLVRQLLPRGALRPARGGATARGARALRERTPDVMLLDLNMPGMDGYEFLERLAPIGDAAPTSRRSC